MTFSPDRQQPRYRRLIDSGRGAIVLAALATIFVPGALAEQQQQEQDRNQQQQEEQQQPQQRRPSRQSRLPAQPLPLVQISSAAPVAVQNLNRVAATVDQIEQVLNNDPGLMLEMKRLVAKEATDHGQVLAEDDLTDQAIYDKLEHDIELRSAATLLLQRYGYLMPTVNPDSALGQEQKVLIQERAIRLARLDEQERNAQPLQTSRPAVPCNPMQDRNCFPSGTSVAEPGQPSSLPPEPLPPSQYLPYGTQPSPLTPTIRPEGEREILASVQGQTGSSGVSPADLGALENQASVAAAAGLTGTNMSGSLGVGTPSAQSGMGTVGSGTAIANQLPLPGTMTSGENPTMVPGGVQPAVYGPREPYANYRYGYGYPYGPEYERPEREPLPELVPRVNPFNEIPSLYDMYMQGASRTTKPERFGIDMFRNLRASNQLIPMDLPVGPDYILGPGDGLTIDLWGSVSQRLFRIVDRTGRVALPEVGPVLVSGRSLGEVQQSMEQLLRTQFHTISADVSITRLRTVRVYVVGDVEHPGAYDVSSLSTPLNAMYAAGGPTQIGSLRVLEHWRGNQLLQTVDTYDLLLHGVRGDIVPLSNGDSVRVPTLGPQVTVEGMVRRPDVYELRDEKTLADVIALAGGILPAATLKHIEVERLVAHEKRTMLSIDVTDATDPTAVEKQLATFQVKDGDVVHVFPMAPYNVDAVYLEGHVIRPGKYAYKPGMKLTDLISSYKDLLPQPSNYAEIIRLAPPDDHPVVESINLAQIMKNPSSAPALDPLDTIRVYGQYDFQDVPTVWVTGEVRRPGLYRTSGQVNLADAIQLAGGISPDADMSSVQVFHYLPDSELKVTSVNLSKAFAGDPMNNIMLGPRDRVLVHRNLAQIDPATVYIKGEIARPGRYPLTVNMRISDLIRVGGGLKRSADPTEADLTRFTVHESGSLTGEHDEVNISQALNGAPDADLMLRDGDTLTIRELPGWQDVGASIRVAGEVVHPGVYGIRPGERLSSVLARAGGLLPTAYPQGIVFERQEVRELQAKSRQDLIQQLKQQSSSFKTSTETTATEQTQLQQAAYLQSERAIDALKAAPITGRMVIRMPSDLKRFRNSPDDIDLRAGDTVLIPKRPDFVLVTGQVYNQNAITYMPHRDAEWYLRQAGGPTTEANRRATFVIRANGSIISSTSSSWVLHGSVLKAEIQPGDTIVVPQKAFGRSARLSSLIGVAQVASSASIAALAIANY